MKLVKISSKKDSIVIRDLRAKFFMMDDAYYNGYARKCGDGPTLVYMALCRHIGMDQTCFPSISLIADRLGHSRRRVIRSVKTLEAWNIISVQRDRGSKSLYTLLDKSVWRKEAVVTYRAGRCRKATKREGAEVKVTWEGERMRTLAQRGKE